MGALNTSAYVSLAVQFITGAVETEGLLIDIKKEDLILRDILTIELFVQTIEFIFYLYLVSLIIKNTLHKDVTSHRYMDWSITTPTMLISFLLFFKYLKNPDRGIRLFESAKEEKTNIIKIVLANAAMLFFGFIAERGFINTTVGVTIGFIPFFYMFYLLYTEYAQFNSLAKTVFNLSFTVWGLYGVAAFLPFAPKNIMYNVLDLFAKNAYGLFLYFFIRSKQV
jgi:bacteriorhodopsin